MPCSRRSTGASASGVDLVRCTSEVVDARADRPLRLLVVEDDRRVRQAIALTVALEPDLVLVAEASDAATALALVDLLDPAVVLVDVLLPDEQTGLRLVRRLAQRPHSAVVAISVRGGLRAAVLAAGAVAFVEKGGDIEALLAAVRAASPTS